jgi:hypothetical protein
MNDSPSQGEGWNRITLSKPSLRVASSRIPIPCAYVTAAHKNPYTHTTHQYARLEC